MTKEIESSLTSFVQSIRWPLNNYILAKAGVKKHEVRLHTPKNGGYLITHGFDYEHKGYAFIHRGISFSKIGILCSSNTSPCLKELILSARVPQTVDLFFGPDIALRSGFESEPTYGSGKTFEYRIDFTQAEKIEVESSNLLKLETGTVHYPFRICSSGLYCKSIAKKHKDELAGSPVPMEIYSQDEQNYIEKQFEQAKKLIELDIALVLDNDEILVYHWNPDQEGFDEGFYNVGVTSG